MAEVVNMPDNCDDLAVMEALDIIYIRQKYEQYQRLIKSGKTGICTLNRFKNQQNISPPKPGPGPGLGQNQTCSQDGTRRQSNNAEVKTLESESTKVEFPDKSKSHDDIRVTGDRNEDEVDEDSEGENDCDENRERDPADTSDVNGLPRRKRFYGKKPRRPGYKTDDPVKKGSPCVRSQTAVARKGRESERADSDSEGKSDSSKLSRSSSQKPWFQKTSSENLFRERGPGRGPATDGPTDRKEDAADKIIKAYCLAQKKDECSILELDSIHSCKYIDSYLKDFYDIKETAEIEKGSCYVHEVDNKWFRVIVLSGDEQILMKYMDYGIFVKVFKRNCTLFEMPQFLKKLPNIVRIAHIRVPGIHGTRNLVNSLLILKPAKAEASQKMETFDLIDSFHESSLLDKMRQEVVAWNDIWVPNKFSDRTLKYSIPVFKEQECARGFVKMYAYDELKLDMRGTIYLLPGFGQRRYGLLAIDKSGKVPDEEALKFAKTCDTSHFKPIKARKNDFVMYRDGLNNDCYGRVTDYYDGKYKIESFTHQGWVKMDAVYRILNGAKDFGVAIEMDYALSKIFGCEEPNKFRFHITPNPGTGYWTCDVESFNDGRILGEAILEKPSPTTDINDHFLYPGSLVQIVARHESANVLYLKKSSDKIEHKMTVMTEKLSRESTPVFVDSWAVGNECYTPVGEDDLKFRGQIVRISDGKYHVFLVDVGKTVVTDKVYSLPGEFLSIPFFAVPVTVERGSSLPTFAINRVEAAVRDEEIFDLTYLNYLDGVGLRNSSTGEMVFAATRKTDAEVRAELEMKKKEEEEKKRREEEEKKKKEEEEKKRREEEEKKKRNEEEKKRKEEEMRQMANDSHTREVLTEKDLKYLNLVSGQKYDLLMMYVNPAEFKMFGSFWMTNMDDKCFQQLLNELTPKMLAYGNSTSNDSYAPQPKELCLASFEDGWYRGVNLGWKDDSYVVLFIDFGNVDAVKPENIRRIKREFFDLPAVALNCTVENFSELRKKDGEMEKVLEFLTGRMNSCLKGVTAVSGCGGSVVLKIPELDSHLKKTSATKSVFSWLWPGKKG